jgi:hypothetical protein
MMIRMFGLSLNAERNLKNQQFNGVVYTGIIVEQ